MKRFKSAGQLRRFVSMYDPIANLFYILRHQMASQHHRELRETAMRVWKMPLASKPPEHHLPAKFSTEAS